MTKLLVIAKNILVSQHLYTIGGLPSDGTFLVFGKLRISRGFGAKEYNKCEMSYQLVGTFIAAPQ